MRAGLVALDLFIGCALVGLGGCAHVEAPPGGPADTIPPVLIGVTPDSLSVRPRFEEKVRLLFDESISERNIERAVRLYPWERRPDVDKGGDDIEVRPRDGWAPDRIYHIVVEPLLQDLFGNRITEPIRYVFSTGPPVPENRVQGRVFDRITGRPLPDGRVDLVFGDDTLRYGATADTAGVFRVPHLPPGRYLAIGFEDRNNNGRADEFDRTDTARVELGADSTLDLTFRVFEHDTVGPTLARAEALDSITVELAFDLYLDPETELTTDQVQIVSAPDSSVVPLDTVLHDWQYAEMLEARRRAAAAADTANAARDTIGAARDAPPDAREVAPAAQDTVRAEGTQQRDTLALPARRILALAESPIPAGQYRVTVRRIPGLTGIEGGGSVEYEQPEPPPEEPEPDEAAADTVPPADTLPSDTLPPDTLPPDTLPPGDTLSTDTLPPGDTLPLPDIPTSLHGAPSPGSAHTPVPPEPRPVASFLGSRVP